jgi:molybdate transport system permease protein
MSMLTVEEWAVVWLSLRIALAATVCSLPFAVVIGYGLARKRIRAPFLVEALLQLPLVLPPVVTGLLLLYLLGPDTVVGRFFQAIGMPIAFNWIGAALAAAIVSFPLMLQTIRTAFEQIDPDLESAGYVYGASRIGVLKYVTLPLAARGIAAGVVLAFARAVGEFGATIMFAGNIPGMTRTLPLAIYGAFNQADGGAVVFRLAAASVALSLLSISAHALLGRKLYRTDGPGTSL